MSLPILCKETQYIPRMSQKLDNFTIERNETQITTSILPLPIFTIYECTAVAITLVHASLYMLLDEKFKSPILGSFLMVTASLYGILITKSKDDTGNIMFDIQSSVFYSDCIKCIAMLTLIQCKEGCSMHVVREVRRLSCSQLLLTCLPAVLFAIQNNLVYADLPSNRSHQTVHVICYEVSMNLPYNMSIVP